VSFFSFTISFFNYDLYVSMLCFSTSHTSLQDAIFQVVAAILHLGNIEFVKGDEIDSSMPKDEKSRFHLQTAADLFM